MRLKFCGIRNQKMVDFCLQNYIDFMGFNFIASSRRKVPLDFCQNLKSKKILKQKSQSVAVFQDQSLVAIQEITKALEIKSKPKNISETQAVNNKFFLFQDGFDIFQFHGEESLNFLTKIKKNYPEKEIWKAFSLQKNTDLATNFEILKNFSAVVDLFLFDGSQPGSGKKIENQNDLEKLTDFCDRKKYPYGIAGGISATNISVTQKKYPKAFLLDTASGIESDGVFDPQKAQKIVFQN